MPLIPAALLSQRDFLRFWWARLAGTAAGQMLMVAVGWQMYDLTGSAWDLGLVGLLQFLPALALVLVTSFMVYLGQIEDWMWLASVLTAVAIWLIHPLMPRQASPNRRIPMIGSRFSPLSERDVITAPTDPRALGEITAGER